MRRILVIDDEPSIRKALQIGLSSREFEVNAAENGKRGVEQETQRRYDVVIVDLCLPDLDGLEVIEQIRIRSPEIVTILITGNTGRDSLTHSALYHVDSYLEKPLDMKTVKDAVKRGLHERERKREAI